MISQKKILIVTTTDSMIGQFLLPHIKHLQDNGNIVECACHKTGFWFDEMVNNGIKVYEVPFARNPLKPTNLKAKKQLYKLCEENDYDLIHCHTPVGGVMGRLAGKKFNIPVLYIAHGFHFYKGAPLINNLVYKNIEKHYSKYTDALVVMNDEDYNAALQMNAKRVYKINGIGFDVEKYSKYSIENLNLLNQDLKINDSNFVILSVGELIKRKNYYIMLETIKILNDSNIVYLICGRGKLKNELIKYTKKLGIQNQVRFLGYRKDINSIMQKSNLFFHASRQEGLTMAIMEAMNYGLPVVTSIARGCRDLIDDKKGGFINDCDDVSGFGDSIKKIMNNKDLSKKMGEYNRNKIKNYSIDIVLKQMEPIYDDIFKIK